MAIVLTVGTSFLCSLFESIVLSTTIAIGAWDEFRIHVRGALNNGLTRDEIKEILMQCAVYAGVPKANHAFKEAQDVLKEEGVL